MTWKAGLCFGVCFIAGFAGAAVNVHPRVSAAEVDPVLANAKVDAQLGKVLSGLLERQRLENALSWAGP